MRKNITISLLIFIFFGCSTYQSPLKEIDKKMKDHSVKFLNRFFFNESRKLVLDHCKTMKLTGDTVILIETFTDVMQGYKCYVYSSDVSGYHCFHVDVNYGKKAVYKLVEDPVVYKFNKFDFIASMIISISNNRIEEFIEKQMRRNLTPNICYIITIAERKNFKFNINQYVTNE